MPLMSLSRSLSTEGFSGLEFASGIPASFGGACIMNAGAHGGEMANVLTDVVVMNSFGEIEEIPVKDLKVEYRHLGIVSGDVVIGGKISLVKGDAKIISQKRNDLLAYRKATQPLTLPSSGSVFRNPSKDLAAGKVLEEIGMKGTKEGDVEISQLHANWIVNPKKCGLARDVRKLVSRCQKEVLEKKGINLEPEIKFW